MRLYVIGVLMTNSGSGMNKVGYKVFDIDSRKTVYASTDSVESQLKTGLKILGLDYNDGHIKELDKYPELLYKELHGKSSDTLLDKQRNHIIILERCMNNMVSVCNVSGSIGKVDIGYIIEKVEKGHSIYNAKMDRANGLCIYDYIPGDLDYQNSEDAQRKYMMFKMFGTSGMHFSLVEDIKSEVCIEGDKSDEYEGPLDIPLGVTSINAKGFMGSTLTEVVIPSSIVHIGNEAFMNSKKLKKLVIESGGELPLTIPDRMCLGCIKLNTVVLPPNVRKIGKDAFRNTGLKKMVVPMLAKPNIAPGAIPRGVIIQWA